MWDISKGRLLSNRVFLYYTKSCVPSEADSGKCSNLLLISCRQDIQSSPNFHHKREQEKEKLNQMIHTLKMILPSEQEFFSSWKAATICYSNSVPFLQTEIKVAQGRPSWFLLCISQNFHPVNSFSWQVLRNPLRVGQSLTKNTGLFYTPPHVLFGPKGRCFMVGQTGRIRFSEILHPSAHLTPLSELPNGWGDLAIDDLKIKKKMIPIFIK